MTPPFWFAALVVACIFGFSGNALADWPYEQDTRIEEEVPAPAPVVQVDVELAVDSTSPGGTRFVAPESGTYTITITGGAFCYLPQAGQNWGQYGGWSTLLHLCTNQPVKWGARDQWGQHPINTDGTVGVGARQATVAQGEAAGKGARVKVDLEKGGYITLLVSDGSDYYSDNSGTVKVRVTGP